MSAPVGMWECPNCGDFVDNNEKFCTHCGSDRMGHKKEAGQANKASKTMPKTYSSYHSGSASKAPETLFEKLFGNPGKVLRVLALIDFWVCTIAGIIGAIVVLCQQYLAHQGLLFFSCLIGGFITGYLSSIALYALGCSAEDAQENRFKLYQIERQQNEIKRMLEENAKRSYENGKPNA